MNSLDAVIKVKGGDKTLVFMSKQMLDKALSGFRIDESLTVRIYRSRSLSQNDIFHVWVRELSQHTGEDFNGMKAYLACRFLGCDELSYQGMTYTIPKSTAEASHEEFAQILTEIHIWALETFNINLSK